MRASRSILISAGPRRCAVTWSPTWTTAQAHSTFAQPIGGRSR